MRPAPALPPPPRAARRRRGAPHRARRRGLAVARPDATAGARQLRGAGRPPRRRPDRLGQRARARALPAAVQPARALRPRRCSTGRRHARRGALFEYWGHEASLLPVALQPLLRWRMARAARRGVGRHARAIARERPELVARVLEDVRERGPAQRASELADDERAASDRPVVGLVATSSARSSTCSGAGQVTPRAGGAASSALYDLPERVLPRRVLARADARRPTSPARAGAHRRPRARRRDRARPARLLPARRSPRRAHRRRRAGRGGRAAAGRGRGLARAGLPAPAARSVPRRIDARALLSARSTR